MVGSRCAQTDPSAYEPKNDMPHASRVASWTMIVGVPRETYPSERRVALVPAAIPSLLKAGLEVVVEAGAGMAAGYRDEDYVSKGAKLLPGRAELFRIAGVITQVLAVGANDRTGEADLPLFRPDHYLIGFCARTGRSRRIAAQELLPLELHSVQELNYQVGEFFDRALYHLARGYESEAAARLATV
jgi:hypothetical protein